MSLSDSRGGHLYMQTNEIRNVVVNYRWSAGGTLTQVERVPRVPPVPGFSPIYHTNRPNDFEDAGRVCLTCKTRKELSTRAYNQDIV